MKANTTLKIEEIKGMNNVTGGKLGKTRSFVVPEWIFNAVPGKGGWDAREGFESFAELSNAHSLFICDTVALCAGGSTLYSVDMGSGDLTSVSDITENYPLSYVEVDNLVYASNKYWCGVWDTDEIREWGAGLDDLDAMEWETETNGSYEFLKNAGHLSATLKPHVHINKPDPMDYICLGRGRIWGAIANKVFYSEPLAYEWFQNDMNFYEFREDVRMIAVSEAGTYVGFDEYTEFITDAGVSTIRHGAIPHTVRRVNFSGKDAYLWISPEGKIIIAGLAGETVSMDNLKLNTESGVGSYFRITDGMPQYLANVIVSDSDPTIQQFLEV